MADQPASPVAIRAVHYCRSAIGTPYVWGGESSNGYDCSGLVYAAYASAGQPIPRVTTEQYAADWMDVGWGQWAPGDLIFSQWPGDGAKPGHVVIYEGDGWTIAAPHTGTTVQREKASIFGGAHYVGSKRPAPLRGLRQQAAAAVNPDNASSSGAGSVALFGVPLVIIAGLAVIAVGAVLLFKSRPTAPSASPTPPPPPPAGGG